MTGFSYRELVLSSDPEAVVRRDYDAMIEAAEAQPAARWRPGRPLRLLLAGYVGAGNTGADIRTDEMIRQLRVVLGPTALEFGALALKQDGAGRFPELRLELMDQHPAQFVQTTCNRYDGVVACEGSLFTSTFSDGLAGMLSACLAYAAAQQKPAVALGAEADSMTPEVASFVQRHCRDVVIFTRNGESRDRLRELGISALPGTDTGWSFVPRPRRAPAELLHDLGWDGRSEVLALCPVNPFWWPVKTDLKRALLLPMRGGNDVSYYGARAFHRDSEDVRLGFEAYLDRVARAVERHARRHPVFTVVVGMEPLDREACERLAHRIGAPSPLIAGDHAGDDLVALLRKANRLVSSRMHAILLTMSAGVPAIGIGYDARIRRLLDEAGHPEQVLEADDEALDARLAQALDRTCEEGSRIGRDLRREALRQLRKQAEMGRGVRLEIARCHPDFPLPDEPTTWSGYLPEIHPELANLIDRDDPTLLDAPVR